MGLVKAAKHRTKSSHGDLQQIHPENYRSGHKECEINKRKIAKTLELEVTEPAQTE